MFLLLSPSMERTWLLTTFDNESARAYPDLTELARSPSRAELARVLGEVWWAIREREEHGEDTELLFYFAGHGDVDAGGEGFLVFNDGKFTRRALKTQIIEASPADVNHVVIDACASYFMVSRGDASSGRKKLSPALLDALEGKAKGGADERTGVFVSTSDAAEVHESARVGGGVFSYLFRSALAGGADIDADGRVEYGEAAAFVASAGTQIADPRARLSVHAEAPTQRPHAPLASLANSGAEHFLPIDGGRDRHVQILDPRGVPLFEVNGGEEVEVKLALIGNPYYLVRVDDKEAVLVPRRAGAYALSSLEFIEAPASRGALGGPHQGLFLSPYRRAFLDGFVSDGGLLPPRKDGVFNVAHAPGGEPAFRFPYLLLGTTGLVAGAGLLAVGGGAVVGNLLSFAALEDNLVKTREIDPTLALEVEAWRLAALASFGGAMAVGGAGAALTATHFILEEGE